MGGTLLRRRGLRRHSPGLSGRERLRPAGVSPADHVARLRTTASEADSAGALTLDDLITDMWQALGAWESAQCPLCGGEMGRGARAISRVGIEDSRIGEKEIGEAECHGQCVDCGTRLS